MRLNTLLSFLFICSEIFLTNTAQACVATSANAKLSDYQKYLATNNLSSYASCLLNNSRPLTSDFDGSLTSLLENYRKLNSSLLTPKDVPLLVSILEKIQVSNHIDKRLQDEVKNRILAIQKIDSRNIEQLFFDDESTISESIDLDEALLFLDSGFQKGNYYFLVDGIVINSSHSRRLINTKRHWTIISNTHFPLTYFGTFDEFKRKVADAKLLSRGNCENPEVLIDGIIFFSEHCVVNQTEGLPISRYGHQKTNSEKLETKTKLFLGILTGTLLYQFKDKKLVITKPSFSF